MSTVIYHNHHIIPKHTGGTNAPDNIARLTVEEHTEAHRLLYEKYGRWQDKIAYQALSGSIGKDEIIWAKQHYPRTEEHNRKISDSQRGEDNHMYGKSHSEESKEQMSESSKGSKNGMFGKTQNFTKEWRRKLSESAKKRKRYPDSPEVRKRKSDAAKIRCSRKK